MASTHQIQAPKSSSFILSYPTPSILLITINRPQQMNSIHFVAHWEVDAILQWFDNEPSLRVAIITGAGSKAFCAGQDLIEQAKFRKNPPPKSARSHPPSGFAGISRRVGKKPIIAAVNGFALGGGFEICLNWNSDLVVASPTASFGLPEATVGLYAAAGGLPRVVRNCGMQVATEIALTGRRLTAEEALKHNLINKISKTQESIIDESVEMAKKISLLSPDAVIVTRAGLRETWETASVERATQIISDRFEHRLFEGENMRIGLEAFATKKKPQWVPSKL
ncbi:Carnitinyl-CoA dehydratase [Lachnellula occidentalis]|uniref:Carnitinyl-CoA dehydratase n=1 Tax=Lachnellula occidentalis TaxID=215460 RepID=A0A8H8UF74_9HELO|nr:Carnitinyl-CoA dehydratase [Lachnellula occidentalis]